MPSAQVVVAQSASLPGAPTRAKPARRLPSVLLALAATPPPRRPHAAPRNCLQVRPPLQSKAHSHGSALGWPPAFCSCSQIKQLLARSLSLGEPVDVVVVVITFRTTSDHQECAPSQPVFSGHSPLDCLHWREERASWPAPSANKLRSRRDTLCARPAPKAQHSSPPEPSGTAQNGPQIPRAASLKTRRKAHRKLPLGQPLPIGAHFQPACLPTTDH